MRGLCRDAWKDSLFRQKAEYFGILWEKRSNKDSMGGVWWGSEEGFGSALFYGSSVHSSEQRQSFSVNIQPMVSLALMKTENKPRNTSLTKIHLFLYFSSLMAWCLSQERSVSCRSVWKSWEQRSACAQQSCRVRAPARAHILLCFFLSSFSLGNTDVVSPSLLECVYFIANEKAQEI